MDAIAFGRAGLQGWRAQVADAVARPVARRSDVAADRVRAVIGAAFFIASVVYVVSTLKRFATGA
jgi:hypothetical protein